MKVGVAMKANVTKLQVIVLITQILQRYECTYPEAKYIIKCVHEHLEQGQRNLEYETTADYCNHHKTYNAENDIIPAMNFVTPYCPEIK